MIGLNGKKVICVWSMRDDDQTILVNNDESILWVSPQTYMTLQSKLGFPFQALDTLQKIVHNRIDRMYYGHKK